MKTLLIIFITLAVLALAISHPAWEPPGLVVSAQGQQGTTVTGTCDCNGFNVTATKLSPAVVPAGSCGYQLNISQTYPTTGTVHVPKGIRITAQSPVTFQHVVSLTSMTQFPPVVFNGATVQWDSNVQLPNGGGAQPLANILLNANGVSPQQILVEWLDEDGVTMCRATLNLECPCRNATAKADQLKICSGQSTTVKLNPVPPASAQITWYKATAPCPPAIPSSGMPTTGWAFAQGGVGNTFNTNPLSQTTCYQAVITEGPNCTYTSSVATVNVGQVANLNNLNPQPICKSGINTFTITDPFLLANPNLVSWQGPPSGATVASGVTTFTTPTLTALTASECPAHIYPYGVTVADSGCGTQTKSLPIIVYHESEAGNLQATPPGPLCYKQATKIKLLSKCGNVMQWEQSTVGPSGPWTPIPGAGTTTDFWTPELLQTTWYRVTVANGVCPAATSVIQVNVKPQLAVTLSSNSNVLCPGPVTLTAQTPIGYPPPLTYRWYRNGALIATTTSPTNTLQITQPGNYRVVVTDPSCGKAKSNVIRIYPKPVVVISGPCGICQGGSIALKANVIGGDPNCSYTFNWSAPGWTGTGQTVNVTPTLAPGASITYTVTTTCAGCTVNAQHTITRCPP